MGNKFYTKMDFFLEVEHVIVDSNIFLVFFYITINDNTHMDECVYPIIVENIYHNEVKDFSMLLKYFPILYLKSIYYEH
jgi:hypothetical protein